MIRLNRVEITGYGTLWDFKISHPFHSCCKGCDFCLFVCFMFKNQISHKADFFPQNQIFSPQIMLSSFVDIRHIGLYPHNLWELHLLQTDILTSLSQAPLYSFVSLTLRKHQLPFIWAIAFLYLLFMHLCDLTCLGGIWVCYCLLIGTFGGFTCYRYWYILIHVCQSLCASYLSHSFYFFSFYLSWVFFVSLHFFFCTTPKSILFLFF